MSCYGCTKKYGIFCKEHGCPSCGYSYCVKCLKREAAVPRRGGNVMNVCLICYDKLSKLQSNEKVIDCEALSGTIVEKAFVSAEQTSNKTAIDEINSLFNNIPQFPLDEILQPTSTMKLDTVPTINESKTNNADIDENLDITISKRLQNLKKIENLASDDELNERLSNLSRKPNKEYTTTDVLFSTDKRSDQEKMNDLLKQFQEEVIIDNRFDNDRKNYFSDIERRLRALRETPIDNFSDKNNQISDTATGTTSGLHTPSDNEDDEQTVLKKVFSKYVAEANLPTNDDIGDDNALSAAVTQPGLQELPWCIICNENAVVRCINCDGDLFCAECFRSFHNNDEDYSNHRTEKYCAPPNFQENHF